MPEKLHGPPETVVEVDQGSESEQSLGLVEIGQRVRHIARPAWRVPSRERPPQERLQLLDHGKQADPLPAADVEGLATDPHSLGGKDVRVNDVVDVGEVARLSAVAVDLHRLAAERPSDEARDDGG